MRLELCGAILAAAAQVFGPAAVAGQNLCDPGEAPDIIVGAITNKQKYGTVGDVTGFAIGTESCNLGTCWANWISGGPNHPVIAQNMYRLHGGRFEQIGQSWLKHGFAALNNNLCGSCIPADGQHLGVNCSDPYGASLNGSQGSLGPRFEVNAAAGTHLHPYTAQGQTGNAIYKRLQVHNADMDADFFPGALYYVEAQYVAADDGAAGNNANNNSYRKVAVFESPPGTYDFSLSGPTIQQLPAIYAWKDNDPAVGIGWIEGFVGASKVTDLGGGFWRYEYAIENVISDRSAGSFTVPLPHGVQLASVGFHDVDYHSGEPYDATDWTVTVTTGAGPNSIQWATASYAENPSANALRWGTLYNFRFDADIPPAPSVARVAIGLFKPGGPPSAVWAAPAPDRCGDAFCEGIETKASCPADCQSSSAGSGEVPAPLTVARDAGGQLSLSWGTSCAPGDSDYEVYEGTLGDFASHLPRACTTGGATSLVLTPAAGGTYYLVVPTDGSSEGSYGADSQGQPRPSSGLACRPQLVVDCDLIRRP